MRINRIINCVILLIGLCCATGSFAQENTLKLISYNVYWGMKQDSTKNKSAFAEWIKTQNPDILALQEMNGFTQQKLQDFARSYGHPYAILLKEPHPDGGFCFPVAITSKSPIVNVQRVVDNMIHGLIVAEIEGRNYLVTHFNPFWAVGRGYEMDILLANVNSKPADNKWLILGDLNSVSPLDKEEYDNGLLLNDIRQDMKKRTYNYNLINDELDYTVQQKLLDAGFIDTFKFFQPRFEASAPTKLFYDQSKYPLRYDYAFVSSNMKDDLVKCEIMKDKFTDEYSDHYPVLLIFKK